EIFVSLVLTIWSIRRGGQRPFAMLDGRPATGRAKRGCEGRPGVGFWFEGSFQDSIWVDSGRRRPVSAVPGPAASRRMHPPRIASPGADARSLERAGPGDRPRGPDRANRSADRGDSLDEPAQNEG